MQFIKGSAILGSIAGLIFAVMMVLVGKIGGFPLLPGATDAARAAASEAGTIGGVNQQVANPEAVFDTTLATAYETNIAYTSTQLAPFLAFGLAIVVGVIIATRLNETQNINLATAGIGMFVGGSLLVIITSLIIGFLGPNIPDILFQAQGINSDFASSINTKLTSPQYTNIIVNGIFAGIGSGAVSAATVFSLNNLMPE
jgi:hypothetical protein